MDGNIWIICLWMEVYGLYAYGWKHMDYMFRDGKHMEYMLIDYTGYIEYAWIIWIHGG